LIVPKLLAKSVFLVVFLFTTNLSTMAGGRRGNTAQALARWQHPVDSSEALDMLHRAKCPTLHQLICMAIEMSSELYVFVHRCRLFV
jgi:hypothetical protein